MNENTTSTRRVNVTLGSGKAVHLGSAMTVNGVEYAASPECGGNRATERYAETNREVTCKRCIKLLAAEARKEAEYQARLEASLSPATESHDLGYVHADEQAAADAQPEEIKAAREEAGAAARGAAYAAQLLAGKANAAPVAPCCAHASMHHGARGCDECGCRTPRDQMKAHQGGAAVPVAYRPWGTDVLPPSVTMDPVTRVLSGQIRDMRDLYLRGLAELNDQGYLVLC